MCFQDGESMWQNSNQEADEARRSQIIEGYEYARKSFNFILKTMEATEGFKHKSYICNVANSSLARLWVGDMTSSITGSIADSKAKVL